LSEAAVQLTTTLVPVMLPNVGVPGDDGAAVSDPAAVVTDALLNVPKLPAASRARTRTVYAVLAVRPVMLTPELASTQVAPPLIEYW
jgi:hypothetical protein